MEFETPIKQPPYVSWEGMQYTSYQKDKKKKTSLFLRAKSIMDSVKMTEFKNVNDQGLPDCTKNSCHLFFILTCSLSSLSNSLHLNHEVCLLTEENKALPCDARDAQHQGTDVQKMCPRWQDNTPIQLQSQPLVHFSTRSGLTLVPDLMQPK